jgi:hypothetical protein
LNQQYKSANHICVSNPEGKRDSKSRLLAFINCGPVSGVAGGLTAKREIGHAGLGIHYTDEQRCQREEKTGFSAEFEDASAILNPLLSQSRAQLNQIVVRWTFFAEEIHEV